MPSDIIASDHPLSADQQEQLAKLLDTLLPASENRGMPSASELNFLGYVGERATDFLPSLVATIEQLDARFVSSSLVERCAAVETFANEQPGAFQELLSHVYACYYEDDRVLEGIGLAAGAPFPRGNTIESGDLSLLDPVVKRNPTYRK